VLATSPKPPAPDDIKKLTLTDIAIMSELAYSLKDHLETYVQIDPYTMPDPTDNKHGFNYYIIVDREDHKRIVSMIAVKKDPLPQLPWNKIFSDRLIKLQLSEQDAATLKYEMMPKDTNNFYPYRRAGRIAGYIMFAFQICGLH
jgi:hypothetical protein